MRLAATALLLTLIAFTLSACSGVSGGGCVANCSTGGSVSLVLTATPAPPVARLSIQAFTAAITGITLTPSSGGSPVAIHLNSSTYIAEFNRVTSDSSLLASNVPVPTGTYDQMTISFAAPKVSSCRQPNPGVPGCADGTLSSVIGTPGSAAVSTNITVSNNSLTGIVLNVDLGSALAQAGPPSLANTFTVSTLPPAASATDLASGQLSHLDDIMGVVTAATSTSITIETSTRGSVSATTNSATIFGCAAQNFSCVQTNQVAVMDAILNSDGTITATFFQPIAGSGDFIEGVVTSVPDTVLNTFTLVATDSVFAPSNSVLNGSLNLGDQITVGLSSAQPFVVVDKGLGNPALPGNNFNGSTSISAILPGMTVLFPVTAYSGQSGTTPGAAMTNSFALRFTRITTTMATATSPQFTITGSALPPYFGLTANQFVLTKPSRLSVDGAQTITAIPVSSTISASALVLAPGNSPAFLAQSVRAH
jgi:hypothetical protein